MVTAERDMRSKELELLQSLVADELAKSEAQVAEVVDQGIVERIFAVAWEHQFERDRAAAQRAIREIVQAAVTKVVDPDAD